MILLDCPECGSAGSIARWMCEICEADAIPARIPHPSIPLRFADVIVELDAIASTAADMDVLDRVAVVGACRRAESLVGILRRQFLDDVVHADVGPAERAETFTVRSSSRSDRFMSAGYRRA